MQHPCPGKIFITSMSKCQVSTIFINTLLHYVITTTAIYRFWVPCNSWHDMLQQIMIARIAVLIQIARLSNSTHPFSYLRTQTHLLIDLTNWALTWFAELNWNDAILRHRKWPPSARVIMMFCQLNIWVHFSGPFYSDLSILVYWVQRLPVAPFTDMVWI